MSPRENLATCKDSSGETPWPDRGSCPSQPAPHPDTPFHGESGREMIFIIGDMRQTKPDAAEVVVAYHFGPNNGKQLRLTVTRGLLGWHVESMKDGKVF